MTEFGMSNLCSPLIAVLTTASADELVGKNNLNFADMLAPFCSIAVNIKDPLGNHVNGRLNLDIRDIRKSGFLLSHTVLPHVIRENIVASFPGNGPDPIFSSAFLESFFYWFEPSNHDFLRSYLCCMFVVSVGESDPVEQLNKLQYQQHVQQHGQPDSSTALTLAHCSPPKWMLPNILKYMVVLQDVSQHSDELAKEVFTNVTKKYGSSFCHLLRINSTTSSQLPDQWASILERRYRGLSAGLERARREILEKSNVEVAQEIDNGIQYMPSAQISRSSTASSFSMISSAAGNNIGIGTSQAQPPPAQGSSLFTTSLIPQILPLPSLRTKKSTSPQNVPAMGNGFIATALDVNNSASFTLETSAVPNLSHGQCLDTGDRERIRSFVDEFVRNSLVPFVEHQLQLQNETLANRRTIGRSFNSVRKWLSAASSTTSTVNANISYGAESSEWQTRVMADMAFQFGLYNFAHQFYQSLKKDFANDQAWLHHAGALEMAAVTSFLAYISSNGNNANNVMSFSPATMALLQKNYPQRYMDNAINYYLNVCMQPLLALRCVLMSVMILTRLELYNEAANHLILLNTLNFSDLYAGVVLERAGYLLDLSRKRRRMALYVMLAGHRYLNAGLPQFALTCYRRVLPLVSRRGNEAEQRNVQTSGAAWTFAEDHILYTLTAQHENLILLDGEPDGARFVVECAKSLLRPYGKQCPEQQQIFLANYVNLSRRYQAHVQPSLFLLPHIDMQNIRVFYGDVFAFSQYIRSTTFASLGTSSLNRLSFCSPVPEGFCPSEGFSELQLDVCHPFLVWEELENAILTHHNARCTATSSNNGVAVESKADPWPLFSDELTDNAQSKWKTSPLGEPITVQLTLNNPLSVPLTLKNLRLGVNVPNGAQDFASALSFECIERLSIGPSCDPGSLLSGRESPKSVDSLCFSKQQPVISDEKCNNGTSQISISVTPSQPMDLLFERLEFELCAPNLVNSRSTSPSMETARNNTGTPTNECDEQDATIVGFIPFSVKGKRLFKKNALTYSTDNRLGVRVTERPCPLLDFRIAGSAGNSTSNRTLGCHRVNAYCNQIYQVLMDVENIGQVPVSRLYMATDRAGLVSLSEERIFDEFEPQTSESQVSSSYQRGKWRLCTASWQSCSSTLTAANGSEGLLIHELSSNINPQKPLQRGGKLTLRLAFRAPSTAETDHHISVLFVYLDPSGAMRQFRYRLTFNTQVLLNASLRPLNQLDGLCALHLRNQISARDSVLVRIELQRFSLILLMLSDVSSNERAAKYRGVRLPFKISNTESSAGLKMDAGIGIQPIFKKPVVLESDQSQNYCFFLTANNEEGNLMKELWMGDFIADIPEWSHLLPVDSFLPFLVEGVSAKIQEYRTNELSGSQLDAAVSGLSLDESTKPNSLFHFRLAVLWKAYVTNSDGTVATVFGENLLSNPFSSSSPTGSKLCRVPCSPHIFVVTNDEHAANASATVGSGSSAFRNRSTQSGEKRSGSVPAMTGSPQFPRVRSNPFTALAPPPTTTAPNPRDIVERTGSALGSISRLAPKF